MNGQSLRIAASQMNCELGPLFYPNQENWQLAHSNCVPQSGGQWHSPKDPGSFPHEKVSEHN